MVPHPTPLLLQNGTAPHPSATTEWYGAKAHHAGSAVQGLQTAEWTHLGDLSSPGAVSGVEVDLLDELHVGQQGDECHEVRVGHGALGTLCNQSVNQAINQSMY